MSLSGYGESGPYVDWPGQDLILQGMSGAMLSAGRAGEPPTPAGQYLVDAVAAYSAFEGALAALLHRERTGEDDQRHRRQGGQVYEAAKPAELITGSAPAGRAVHARQATGSLRSAAISLLGS